MADFNLYYPKLIQYEGGYSNNPNDTGGETYKGISRNNFPHWYGWVIIDKAKGELNFPHSLNEDIGLDSIVNAFYKTEFWDKWLADQINNQSLAELVVDWEINSGVTGIKVPQRILGVTPDGIVGNQTIHAMNAADQQTLFNKIWGAHHQFYVSLVEAHPNDEVFLQGWENRLNKQIFVA